jgi:hypothetical protein
MRGRINSPLLESALRGRGSIPARVPHKGEIQVNPTRFLFQLSSNGVETTRDLANRSSIVRIRKQPKSYQFHQWPEGDLLDHIRAQQAFYLGCVFAVVRAWHAAGKLRTAETRHDFRQWTQILDWIVQNVFKLAPLMDGHEAAQERVSNPALTWLRAVALAVDSAGELGQEFSATMLHELCQEHAIEIPGLRGEPDENAARQHIGRTMAKLFEESDRLNVDGYTVRRVERMEFRKQSRQKKSMRFYTVGKEAKP